MSVPREGSRGRAEAREMISLIEEMAERQKNKVLRVARRSKSDLTPEDLLNPYNHPELETDPVFHYEDGHLAGLLAAATALRALMKRREEAEGTP